MNSMGMLMVLPSSRVTLLSSILHLSPPLPLLLRRPSSVHLHPEVHSIPVSVHVLLLTELFSTHVAAVVPHSHVHKHQMPGQISLPLEVLATLWAGAALHLPVDLVHVHSQVDH